MIRSLTTSMRSSTRQRPMYETDLAVVGAGFAGLTAANRAAQLGLRVLVLERGASGDYPCNSRVCTGVYHIAWVPDILDSDSLYDRIVFRSGGTARRDLANLLAVSAAPVRSWLVGEGAKFQSHYSDPDGPATLSPRRRLCAGLDWQNRGPDLLLRRLSENLVDRGGGIHFDTTAESLVLDRGVCKGVRARRAGAFVEYRTAAVVIADGGFQADSGLVSRHIAPSDGIQQRNTGTGRGDGLRMAEKAGAMLVGMDKFYGHLLSRDAFSNDRLWPYPQLDVLAARNVVVDASGRRFADEGFGGVYMSNAIAKLDDPRSVHIIFDRNAWDSARGEDTVPANPALVEAGGTIYEADTTEGLASMIGVPDTALDTTLAEYNSACSNGDFTGMRPARNTALYTPLPVLIPPFRAVPVCAGITVTTGGIAVDGMARVLRPDDTPIPGLFAAGSATGGVEGGPKASYVGGLVKAFVLGHRAGESVAESVARSGAVVCR